MSELQKHVLVEVSVGSTSSSVRTKTVAVRSMSKALSRARLAEHKVWHIEADLDRFFMWFVLCAYQCFYCCKSAADVRTHILADHINQPFSIAIKKESSDDDDG
jgi:hypothetical protein